MATRMRVVAARAFVVVRAMRPIAAATNKRIAGIVTGRPKGRAGGPASATRTGRGEPVAWQPEAEVRVARVGKTRAAGGGETLGARHAALAREQGALGRRGVIDLD